MSLFAKCVYRIAVSGRFWVYPPNARLPAFSTFPGVCECRPLFARIFAPQEALIALGYSRGSGTRTAMCAASSGSTPNPSDFFTMQRPPPRGEWRGAFLSIVEASLLCPSYPKDIKQVGRAAKRHIRNAVAAVEHHFLLVDTGMLTVFSRR